MELDDLKNQWQQADKIQKPKNQNMMELIQNKSYGPLAELKRSFKKQMIVMSILPILILATNMQQIDKTLTSALFWVYVMFCIGITIVAKLNYRVVQKMEGINGNVKSNLEQQIFILETRIRQNLLGVRIALLCFIILTEVLPYFQNFHMLNTWHSLSPFIRFGAYAALFLLQIFVTPRVSYSKFGKHIDHLKDLVKQME